MTTYTSKKTAPNTILVSLYDIFQGQNPVIDRTTKTDFGYSVETLRETIRVRLGKRTVYYAKDKVNPFGGRVYRLVSRPNTKDYIIRPVKR